MTMRGFRIAVPALLMAAMLSAPRGAEAQRHTYTKGQPVYPAYEGWTENEDGSIDMNENWVEEPDVPVGPGNAFSPGQADRGQPTHFLPRRNRFVFKVRVPSDFTEDDELVWTLRANGQEHQAFGTLREDLYVDNVVIMSETGALGAGSSSPEIRANIPPVVELEGATELTVRAGETVTLTAVVTDDGQPVRASAFGASRSRARSDDDGDEAEEEEAAAEEEEEENPRDLLERALDRVTATVTVSKRLGLHFTWFVYRGNGESVEFDPPQIKPWEDTRPFANSPWAVSWQPPTPPEDGRWVSEVVFTEPGTYVLHGRADDGGLYTDVEVIVRVQRPTV
jgi:hypothetical protein